MTVLQGQGHGLGNKHLEVLKLTAEVIDRGQDSVDPAGMQQGLDVYCGYQGGAPGYRRGSYSNMAAIKSRFPHKHYVCVGTDCIDIEPGLATPDNAPGFVNQWHKDNTNKPVVYASMSQMAAVRSYLNHANIARSRYYLWVAEWNGGPIPSGYDAIQNGSTSRYDSDLFQDYMFSPVSAPAPPPPPPVPVPTVPSFSVTPHPVREVVLNWAPPKMTVDHFVIVCHPASLVGVIRPNGTARTWKFPVASSGPVTITISAIDAHGKVGAARTVHI